MRILMLCLFLALTFPLHAYDGEVLLSDSFESLESPAGVERVARGTGIELVEGSKGQALQLAGETIVIYPAPGHVDPDGGELSFKVRLDFDPTVESDAHKKQWRNQVFLTFTGKGKSFVKLYTTLSGVIIYVSNEAGDRVWIRQHLMTMGPDKWIGVGLRWGEKLELVIDGEPVFDNPQSGLFGNVPYDTADQRIILGTPPGSGIENKLTFDELVISGPTPELITPRPRMSLPKLDGAPKLDGDLDESFWTQAGLTSGFGHATSTLAVAEQPRVFGAYTDEGLYLAFEVPLPDGRLPSAVLTGHDAAVYTEDSVEIFLQAPDAGGRFYQLMVSASGERFDARQGKDDFHPDQAWNADWQVAAHQEPGLWRAEVFVPFAVLDDLSVPDESQLWRGNFCVNYAGLTQSNGATWAVMRGNYRDDTRFGQLLLTDSTRAMRQDVLTGMAEGRVVTTLTMTGPLGTPVVEVDATISDVNGKTVFEKKNPLRDSISTEISSDFLPSGVYAFKTIATEENDGTMLWRQRLMFEAAVAFSLDAEVYPTYRSGAIIANVAGSRDPVASVEAHIVTVDRDAPSEPGEEPGQERVRITEFHNGEGRGSFSTEGMAPGEYRLVARALGQDGTTLHESETGFTVYPEPDWLHNDYGTEHTVPAPYEPVVFTDDSVNVWGREHRVGKNILPHQIVNQGIALVEPMTVTIAVDGETIDLAEVPRENEERFDDVIRLSGSQGVGGAAVDLQAGYEFDGCVRFDIVVNPEPGQKTTVERLQINLPLDSRVAKLFMFSTGSSTSVTEVTDEPINRPFAPLFWLGNDDQGLCVFSESDQWWRPRDDARIEIIPQGDRTILRLNIVTEPIAIDQPMTLTMGLMATPVRELPTADPFYYIQMRSVDAPITFPERLDYAGGERFPGEQGTIEFDLKRSTGDPQQENLSILNFMSTKYGSGPPLSLWLAGDQPVLNSGSTRHLTSTGTLDLSADEPTHLALVWTPQAVNLYADGQRISHAPMTDELRGLIARTATPEGLIRLGCHDQMLGYTAIVVDNLRLSDVARYQGEQADVPTGPVVKDKHTVIADTFDADFLPDGEDATTPGGGVPSLGSRFVDADHGKALKIEVGPARNGMEMLQEIGVDNFMDYFYWHGRDRYVVPQMFTVHDPTTRERTATYRRHGINPIPYFSYPGIAGPTELEEQFADEWSNRPYSVLPYEVDRKGHYAVSANVGADGYSDYLAAGMVWIIEDLGYEGFYTDGAANFAANMNTAHGAGYIDENGNRRSTYPIFSSRETLKRMYRIAKTNNPDSININHTSFQLNIPLLSMGDVQYTGEHEDYSNTLITRVRYSSEPWGVWVATLGASSHHYSSYHTMISLLHGVGMLTADLRGRSDWSRKWLNLRDAYQRFGYRDATWVPYFKGEGEYYTIDADDVRISMYVHDAERGGGALMIIGNYSREPRDVNVTLDLDKLNLSGVPLSAYNALTRQGLEVAKSGVLSLRVPPESFVLAELRDDTEPGN